MKNLKTTFLLLFAFSFITFIGCKDDDPVTPDYSTYSFENFLLTDDVELVSSDGYSFTVTLNRSESNQEDDITVELSDPSGIFGFSDGTASMVLTFAENESSKAITVQPVSTTDVSFFETYDLTVDLVPPSGTDVIAEFSKSVNASVAVNFQSTDQGHMAFGWSVAHLVYGSAEKDFDLEKDSNVPYYKCLNLYVDDYDILFGIDDGNVVIENDQRIMTTDPALFGAALIVIMKVTATEYDSANNTVSITYDIEREDGGIFAGLPLTDITDVITLP